MRDWLGLFTSYVDGLFQTTNPTEYRTANLCFRDATKCHMPWTSGVIQEMVTSVNAKSKRLVDDRSLQHLKIVYEMAIR